jgi:hypothetical protein
MATDATRHFDIAGLIDEIARYLAAVDLFRAEGREPQWLGESAAPPPARKRGRRLRAPIA